MRPRLRFLRSCWNEQLGREIPETGAEISRHLEGLRDTLVLNRGSLAGDAKQSRSLRTRRQAEDVEHFSRIEPPVRDSCGVDFESPLPDRLSVSHLAVPNQPLIQALTALHVVINARRFPHSIEALSFLLKTTRAGEADEGELVDDHVNATSGIRSLVLDDVSADERKRNEAIVVLTSTERHGYTLASLAALMQHEPPV